MFNVFKNFKNVFSLQKIGKDRLPSLDDKPDLHYTNAVLFESFRYTSFVFASVPHYATSDVRLREYVIPKGAIVLISLYHVMHDPEYFKDPETFNPDRFLNENGEFVNDERVIPFGIGKRFCLGQSLAEKEFFLFFTGLMQKFKFEPGNKPLPSYKMEDLYVKELLRCVPAFETIIRHNE